MWRIPEFSEFTSYICCIHSRKAQHICHNIIKVTLLKEFDGSLKDFDWLFSFRMNLKRYHSKNLVVSIFDTNLINQPLNVELSVDQNQ